MTRPRTGYPFLDAGLEDHPAGVLAFAHRGGAYHPELEGLENTLAAFTHAIDLGYHYLETDVHVTKDGALLAFHDTVLDRVTEHLGAVADLDLATVSTALIGGREQIPTMSSLLERFPDARFNIDIKADAAIEPLAELISAHDAQHRVCVASFSASRTRRFRARAGGRVATAYTPLAVGILRFLPVGKQLRRTPGAALQVPRRRGGIPVVTPGLVARAHAIGKHVHVWTVDDPGEMNDLLDMGVDGLMTDRTDLLRKVLTERGQWMGASA